MDAIEACLALVPLPYISNAFSVFRMIWMSVQEVKASNAQLRILSYSVAKLLQILNEEYRQQRLVLARTSSQLDELNGLLQEIARYVKKQSKENFVKLLLTKDERIPCIEGYHRRIAALITALLDVQDWQLKSDKAREEDQRILNDHLQKNQDKLIEHMESQHSSLVAMIVSLERKLDQQSTVGQERLFFSQSLTYLSTLSGRPVQVEDWMVTSYDVDFIEEIGSGGFGQVFRGTWSKTEVALKVLKAGTGISPSSEAIVREVTVWSKLRHPHILQFLGANVLDENPFIVMPYMKNGNARDYVQRHPDANRLQLLRDISLGLNYLHSKNIIHGDLKAMNVLVDDNIRAVLCDFGLSRLKADATSRTVRPTDSIAAGSRNWMAPECILGGSLRKPADIYAFGMTIYELYTNEIPLGHIHYADFVELVARHNVRPERPDHTDAPGLSAEIWSIAELCWERDPLHRPESSALCDKTLHLISTARPSVFMAAGSGATKASSPVQTQPPQRISDVSRNAARRAPPPPPPRKQRLPTTPQAMPRRPDPVWPDPLPVPPQVEDSLDGLPTHLRRSLVESRFILGSPGPLKKDAKSVVWCIAVSPGWKQIVSGSDDGIVRIWDAETDHAREFIGDIFKKGRPRGMNCVAFSPDGNQIAAVSNDRPICIWNSGTGVCRQFLGHIESVCSVAFSLDGRRMVSRSLDDTIRIWDVETGTPRQLTRDRYSGAHVAFSPDGKNIASGTSITKDLCIWDATTGVSRSFPGHKLTVRAIAWSPDGQYVASGADDADVRILDVNTGSSRVYAGHTDAVQTLAFSPDGKYIASGSRDKTVRVFDTKTGAAVKGPLSGHGSVHCVAFSNDGKCILSACSEGLVRVWRM